LAWKNKKFDRKKGFPTSITLDEEMLKWLSDRAEKLGLNRTDVIKMCIKQQMDFDAATKK
jgi:hypothetical protein